MAIKPVRYKGETFKLSYDMVNPTKRETLLFLHGWGSNKELMKQAFGDAFQEYRHLYLDLPGFGKSDNHIVLTTDDYAKIVAEFLHQVEIESEVIIGHSFGGKVATLLAPKRLILLSSAGIVLPKPLKVRTKIALFKLLKPFGGHTLRKFFVSSDAVGMPEHMYETFKNVVDEDFSDIFSACKAPTLLCWGREDSATPLKAGEKMAKLIPDSKLTIFDGDHYFFLQQKRDVVQTMEAFLETV